MPTLYVWLLFLSVWLQPKCGKRCFLLPSDRPCRPGKFLPREGEECSAALFAVGFTINIFTTQLLCFHSSLTATYSLSLSLPSFSTARPGMADHLTSAFGRLSIMLEKQNENGRR